MTKLLGHPDLSNVRHALETMKDLARFIDENKSVSNEREKILSIKSRLINWPSV
jgi:hypothetical protein